MIRLAILLVLCGWCACGRNPGREEGVGGPSNRESESASQSDTQSGATSERDVETPESADPSRTEQSEFHVEDALDETRKIAVDPCRGLDDEACYREGWDLAHPAAGDPRWKDALPYFHRGCDRRYQTACAYLGLLYHHGVGVAQNGETAFDLYVKACNLGESRVSCLNAGVLLLARTDVAKADETRAIEWFKRSCDEGEPIACHNVGISEVGAASARLWFRRACELGDKISCELLAKPPSPASADDPPSHSRWRLPPPPVLTP